MYTPIDRLPQFDGEECAKYRSRWREGAGPGLRDTVLEMIRAGAGEDFLQWEFEEGRLGFLENMWDLRGLSVFKEEIVFPDGDTFEAIDFSFAEFYHSKFTNAVFNCSFAFAKVYNCEFHRCIFSFNHFYATTLEKVKFVECEFVNENSFANCDAREMSFEKCYTPKRLFFDCRFDGRTRVQDTIQTSLRMKEGVADPRDAAEVFNGIKEAYRAGGIPDKARGYFFRQMQAATRYNSETLRGRVFGLLKEYGAGYGVRPGRVLAVMLGVFAMSSLAFSMAAGSSDGFLLAAGALFTFGAKAEVLGRLHPFYQVIYIATAFIGISLTALFVAVCANAWFREY